MVLLHGYTYYGDTRCKSTDHWKCTNGPNMKCRAVITTTKTEPRRIIRMNIEHNHPPPKKNRVGRGLTHKIKTVTYYANHVVQWLRNTRGNPVALFGGLTFRLLRRRGDIKRWMCTMGRMCRGAFSVTVSNRNNIFNKYTEHNHPPVKNYFIKDGVFIKV
ncbi:FLYWCH zinc finger domain-containing protein [Phthorimaea operculella]|nr:FLYWCH zinc finger domain-containing protein [Phthorimaea operculella]